ncbi:unnamed protein product [Camellia sinensis]
MYPHTALTMSSTLFHLLLGTVGLPQTNPLERWVHHHIPYDGVKHPIPRSPSKRHRLLRLLVLDPNQRIGVFKRYSDLVRVTPREPDRHEDGVEMVDVEVGGRAPEVESSGFEIAVGDGVVVVVVDGRELSRNGDVPGGFGGGETES